MKLRMLGGRVNKPRIQCKTASNIRSRSLVHPDNIHKYFPSSQYVGNDAVCT